MDGKSSGHAPNLPNRVNEYGFDTGTHGSRAWWVVKASSLAIPDFTFTPFDRNSSGSHQFGRRLSLDGEKLIVGYGDSNQRKLEYLFSKFADGNLTYHEPNCSKFLWFIFLQVWAILCCSMEIVSCWGLGSILE